MAVDVDLEKKKKEWIASLEKQWMGVKYDGDSLAKDFGLPKLGAYYNTTASADNIRKYVDGTGDLNPRFRDPEYAKKTKYGRLVAPPCFLYSVTSVGTGRLAKVHAPAGGAQFHSGDQWEFFRPTLEGDQISYNGLCLSSIEVKPSKFAGEMVLLSNLCEYRNQRGEVLGLGRATTHYWLSVEVVVETGKYKEMQKPYRYSDDELHKIAADYEKEVMRGSEVRYWEDVVEGESIPHIVNGPRGIMDCVSWSMGAGYFFGGRHGARILRLISKKTGTPVGTYDAERNIWVNMNWHLEDALARQRGAPGAFDVGVERSCMASALFDNWVGDDGFVWKYYIQLRRPFVNGDTVWYKGKVTRKYIDDGKCCVDLEFWGDNQKGERMTVGGATAILASKAHGPVKYPSQRRIADVYPAKHSLLD